MNAAGASFKKESLTAKYRRYFLYGIPLAAVLFQVYVPRFFDFLSYLELTVMVTVYYSLVRRSPVAGVLYGMGVGLAQDSLSHHPLGMFGIVKTLVGYMTAFLTLRFDIDSNSVRFTLMLVLYLFHQVLYWILTRALLGENTQLAVGRLIIVALLNAAVAVPLFQLLDRLKLNQD